MRKINRLRRIGLMCRLAKRAPPGNLAEVGVYRGHSAKLLYQIAIRRKSKLWLYDTFTGHPYHNPGLDHPKEVVGYRWCGPRVIAAIQRVCPEALMVEGIFPQSVDPLMQNLAFVHIDVDSFQSTDETIAYLKTRMVPGGIMLFDDYGKIRGARLAVQKHFKGAEIYVVPIIRRGVVMIGGDIQEFMRAA